VKNEIIFVSGQRGSGKTTWVKRYLENLDRFILWDFLAEYDQGKRFENIQDFLEHCEALSEHGGFLDVVLNPIDETSFPFFCRAALPLGNLYVIVEELDVVARANWAPIEFQAMVKRGRHYNVNVIGVSRRPAEVSRLFTSQATRFILFRQVEPTDISYFRSMVGIQANKLPSLDQFHYFDIDFDQPWDVLKPQKIELTEKT